MVKPTRRRPKDDEPSHHFDSAVFRAFAARVHPTRDASPPQAPDSPSALDGVAALLELEPTLVHRAAADATCGRYRRWTVPKRRGQRRLCAPSRKLAAVQRAIVRWLESAGARPHDAAHGFVRGRSHATHAALHVGRAVVASIDIQDCFGTLTDLHLRLALEPSFAADPSALDALIELVTVERGSHGDYERTNVTRCLDLLDQHLAERFPETWVVLLGRTRGCAETSGPSKAEVTIVGRELAAAGLATHLDVPLVDLPGTWSETARRVATFDRWLGNPARSRTATIRSVAEHLSVGPSAFCDAHGRPVPERLREALGAWKGVRLDRTAFPLDERILQPRHRLEAPAQRLRVPLPRRVLPQGAPSSPLLANLCLAPVDDACAEFAARHGLTYSRYADDLAFSGDALPDRFVHEVATILERWGLRLNRNKVTARWRNRRQLVTGIVVNERMAPAHVSRRVLRAILHAREHGRPIHVVRDGQRVELSEDQVRGLLAYWHMVDPGRVP